MAHQVSGQAFRAHESYYPRVGSQTTPTSGFSNSVTGAKYQSLPAHSQQASNFHNQQPLNSSSGTSICTNSWTAQHNPSHNELQSRYTGPAYLHQASSQMIRPLHSHSNPHQLHRQNETSTPGVRASANRVSEVPSRPSEFSDIERTDNHHFENVIITMNSTKVSTDEYKALVRETLKDGRKIGLNAAMIKNMVKQTSNGIVIQDPGRLLQTPQKRNQLQHIYHTLCTQKGMEYCQRPSSPSRAVPTPQPSITPARTQSHVNFEQTRRNEHSQAGIDALAKYKLSQNEYNQMKAIIIDSQKGVNVQEMKYNLDECFKFEQGRISMINPEGGYTQKLLNLNIIPTLNMMLL
ncbi:hypothetical protein JQC92_13960 [Shewanella sp. 202IG2-18]|uniref:hypothetical protein n=1 Tax=Parashewanella hymeniacidonis TaxID=2807618 RepID=UPI001960B64B|nr:hypothetical protein [Parashewanella hymeniacidonis]MBM7073119.1 hypothetical protein [Parashewanella hymeniacidonis]